MNEHPRWAQQVKSLLDESAQSLDAATLSRLNRARKGALEQRRQTPRNWVFSAALASACALLLAVAVWHGRPSASRGHDAGTVAASAATANDADVLADDDEFYDDLDFYAWLDAQEQNDPQG